ncbi:hypothetical protein D3C87_1865280 [compost metagenome]
MVITSHKTRAGFQITSQLLIAHNIVHIHIALARFDFIKLSEAIICDCAIFIDRAQILLSNVFKVTIA